MTRMVYCQKLKKEAEGLEASPYPGDIGERVFKGISSEAWSLWLERQTMFINEYRLNLMDRKAREFLVQEMEKFLFSDEQEQTPPGYVPPEQS